MQRRACYIAWREGYLKEYMRGDLDVIETMANDWTFAGGFYGLDEMSPPASVAQFANLMKAFAG